nr:hypothetical protein [Tanacetum cinerariifolium]
MVMKVDDMTIIEYMNYEERVKRQSSRSSGSYFLTYSSHNTTIKCPSAANFNDIQSNIKFIYDSEDMELDEAKTAPEFDLKNSSKDMEDTINDDNLTRNLPNESPFAKLNPGGFLLPFTIGNYNSYDMANIYASNNVMPKSICEYLMLDNLEGADMKTIHAQIDVFQEEISLGIAKERIKFGVNGNLRSSNSPIEKVYMANASQEEESFCNAPLRKEDVMS